MTFYSLSTRCDGTNAEISSESDVSLQRDSHDHQPLRDVSNNSHSRRGLGVSGREFPSQSSVQPGVRDVKIKSLQGPVQDSSSFAEWGVGWKYPVLVGVLLLLSVLVAVGHHLYYQSLENKPVESSSQQTWAIRIGTGLAFLYKTGLVAIIGMAATQQIWFTLRRKFVSLRGIDSMFMIMNDPTATFTGDIWTGAKTLILLAVISWLVPLVAVVTPATLSVISSMETSVVSKLVPIANFTDITSWVSLGGAGFVSAASFEISRHFAATFSSLSVLPMTAPFPNSSYELNFWGPSYKCNRLSDVAHLNSPDAGSPDPGNPNSKAIYKYSSFQAAWDKLVQPLSHISDVYVGVAPDDLENTIFIWTSGFNSQWDKSSNETKLVCQLYNTTYDVSIKFEDGVQSVTPLTVQQAKQPITWTSTFGAPSMLTNQDIVTSYATMLLFNYLLVGNLTVGADGSVGLNGGLGTMPLLQSGLMACPEILNSSFIYADEVSPSLSTEGCRNRSLAAAIEDLSRNFTYSVMSFNNGRGGSNATVPVTVRAPRNIYSYDKATLLVAYGASLLVVLLVMGVGSIALWDNGMVSSSSFSTILLTTRNADLDSLAEGHCLGAHPLPDEIGQVKLKFGCLEGKPRHAAFGLDGTMISVTRGDELL